MGISRYFRIRLGHSNTLLLAIHVGPRLTHQAFRSVKRIAIKTVHVVITIQAHSLLQIVSRLAQRAGLVLPIVDAILVVAGRETRGNNACLLILRQNVPFVAFKAKILSLIHFAIGNQSGDSLAVSVAICIEGRLTLQTFVRSLFRDLHTIVFGLVNAASDSVLLLQNEVFIAGGAGRARDVSLTVQSSLLFTNIVDDDIVGVALVTDRGTLVNQAVLNRLVSSQLDTEVSLQNVPLVANLALSGVGVHQTIFNTCGVLLAGSLSSCIIPLRAYLALVLV